MSKILVTGGTGFIGRHLTEKLAEDKTNEIFCLVRDASGRSNLDNLGVKIIISDLVKPETLANLPAVDEVFHLAGKLGEPGVPDKVYWDLHLEGTKNLVQALDKNTLKKFFFFSSPSVAGPNTSDKAWQETDPYAPSNIYELTKAETEKFLLSQNLPLTIIRPEFVYGPGDRHVLKLIKSIKDQKFFIIGSGKSLLQPTYVDDVVAATLLIRQSDKTINQIYLVAGQEKISVKDFSNLIAEILKVKMPSIKIPRFIAYLAAAIFQTSAKVFGVEPLLTVSRIKFFTQSHTFNATKINRELNFSPRYSVRDGLQTTINWYKENGWL